MLARCPPLARTPRAWKMYRGYEMAHPHLTYLEAIVVGLLQGVTELFPVSSLGHAVLVPALVGGSWARDLSMSADQSPYLAFLVAVHVATAVALVVFFRRDWTRIVLGLVTSVRNRAIRTPDERLAWLLVVATIPVGIAGLALEHVVRTTLGRPVPAAIFLILNGVVLATVERLGRRGGVSADVGTYGEPVPVGLTDSRDGRGGQVYASTGYAGAGSGVSAGHGHDDEAAALASDRRLTRLSWKEALQVGGAQILALLPGISRSGSTIAAGLLKGLSHEDAARFAFLLATPVIAAAGVLKLPELAGPAGRGVLGPVLVGSLVAGAAAYVSLRFLTRYFETRTLNPFALYCMIAGFVALVWVTLGS
jgi:undecaprenyl-diphosphatase